MKKYKCPVCKERTIDFTQKRKMYYRYRWSIKCSNCRSELTESNIVMVAWGLCGAIAYFILMLSFIHIILRIILVALLFKLYNEISVRISPIVVKK
ncbi:hypothetical protein PV797_12325 [Clostridiaceae bacterium M8S5]|nr:hypothetical protein PV797_12325 [Clostridiaceae bacterium M8S5]